MTDEEWKEFYDSLFLAFPALYRWMLEACPVKDGKPNIKGTLDVWRRTLNNITKTELMAVLDSWITGLRNPPEAYQRENTALILRQSVLFDRQQTSRKKSIAEAEERHAKKPQYERHSNFQAIWNLALEANRKLAEGEYTEEQWEEAKEHLSRQVT